MANLLDMAKGYLSDQLMDQLTGATGENKSGVAGALGGMVPTLLAGLMNKSSDTGAMTGIFNMLNDDKNDGLLDNLGGLIGNNAQGAITSSLLSGLFGDKVGGILDLVGSATGIKKSSSSTLMSIAAPLVMGMLRKKISGGGLNLGGLLSMLNGEKDSIMSALPEGMDKEIGLAAPEAPKGGNMRLLWLALAALAGFFLYKNCSASDMMDKAADTVENVAENASDAAGDAANAVADAAGDAADAAGNAAANAADAVTNFFKHTLPGGFEINGAADGVENSVIAFIGSDKPLDKTTWFNFDALRFQTGSDQLDMDYSGKQLTNVVEILKAYPKVNLKLGGYTDNVGDDKMNLALSQRRADNVMKAIVAAGVDAARLAAEGYGEAHPVCPANDTDECKAKNRRIAVRVTAK